jgi:hypothetical protein
MKSDSKDWLSGRSTDANRRPKESGDGFDAGAVSGADCVYGVWCAGECGGVGFGPRRGLARCEWAAGLAAGC